MTRRALPPALLLLLLAVPLAVSACWEQFQDTDPPLDDDDTSLVDDDDLFDDDDSVDDDDLVDVDDTGGPECLPDQELSSGELVLGNNNAPGGTNAIEGYGCSAIPLTGPEYAYEFTSPADLPVTVHLSGLTADLDLVVLQDAGDGLCDPFSCLDSSNSSGEEEVAFDGVAGTTYYVVIDGYDGAISNYELAVICGDGPEDDDDSAIDDDDSAILDDDDSAPIDDDDSAGDGDDDDSAGPVPCTGPANVVPTVTLTDPAGAPTTELSVGSPMTVTLSLENLGGVTETQVYGGQLDGNPCLFAWSLWYTNGNPVNGGPSCFSGFPVVDFVCAAPATTDAHEVVPIEGISGNPVPAGSYNLEVNTYHYGTLTFPVTVP